MFVSSSDSFASFMRCTLLFLKVCRMLPSMNLREFSAALTEENAHEKVVTLLAGVTKILCIFDEMLSKNGQVFMEREAKLSQSGQTFRETM